jgi:hypothetical protein
VLEIDIWTRDIGTDNNFELLLNWLELASADAAANYVVPRRTQRILTKFSKSMVNLANQNEKELQLPEGGSEGQCGCE